MIRRSLVFLLAGLGIALLAACGQPTSTAPAASAPAGASVGKRVATQGGAYTDITPKELQAMLARKDFTFVNVHIPFEGDIAQTDVSIPYNEIDRNLNKLPADKNARIVLYCRSGRMSTEAAQVLVKQGYTNIFQLAGGMLAWEKDGYPLLQTPK